MKKYVLQQNPCPKMSNKKLGKKVERFVKRILKSGGKHER